MGTGLKRHEFGLPAAWNRRGTLGTGPQNAPKLLDYAGSRRDRYPEEDARKNYPQELVVGFLQRPYTATALTEKVRELIGNPSQDGGRIIENPAFG